MSADIQFAWRCFTNDLSTPDIMGAYDSTRPSILLHSEDSTRRCSSLIGTSGGSRHSARAGNAPGASGTAAATTAAPAAGKKGGAGGGKDKAGDEKSTSKQQPQVTVSASITDLPGRPLSNLSFTRKVH